MWVPHIWLTDIPKTWWFKSCQHMTPLSHPHAILTSYVCPLLYYFPHMGHMDWSITHMPRYPSPTSCRTVVFWIVGHTTPFVFEHMGVVYPCLSWWHTFYIYLVIPSPSSQLVISPATWLYPRLFTCEDIPSGCKMWPHPDLHVHPLLK